MKLQISKSANINYLAKVINITNFTPHPNPEVTRMKVAHIDGYSICVGIDEPEGLYVYFPTMCQINEQLLSYLNLYADKELNANPESKCGFFSKNGRVKTIRLKGFPSEGFLLPFEKLQEWILASVNVELPIQEDGIEFDEVEHNGKTFWVCKKYVVKEKYTYTSNNNNRRDKRVKKFDILREDQFHFHYDTTLIKKCPNVIKPDDLIHISVKWHGTSHISSYILCHKPLNWREKIAKWLTGYVFDIYDYIYSSRSVIKNKYYNPSKKEELFGFDEWWYADNFLKPFLVRGMSIYCEIVGFKPDGNYIQKNYDYGCKQPDGDRYIEGEHYKIYIYRITTVNVDGYIHEWSTQEVQVWCKRNGLRPVTQLYYGKAKDLYPDLDIHNHWNENFIERLANDKNFYMEMNSPDCVNKVPNEGIVIKIEDMISRAFKLKCFKFLDKEQEAADKGEVNTEDNA